MNKGITQSNISKSNISNGRDAGLINVNYLFQEQCIYWIPNYQRAFEWQTKEVTDFLNDLENSLASNQEPHFLGTFILRGAYQKQGIQSYDIIDGQQRFTLLILFFHGAIKALNKLKKEAQGPSKSYFTRTIKKIHGDYLFREFLDNSGETQNRLYLTPSDFDKSFFEDLVNNKNPKPEPERKSQRCMLAAVKQILEWLECQTKPFLNLKDKRQHIEKICGALEQWQCIRFRTKYRTEASRIFYIINSRGTPLSLAALVRARIIESLDQQREIQEEVALIWNEIFIEPPNIIDKFLKQCLISRMGKNFSTPEVSDILDVYFPNLENGAKTKTAARGIETKVRMLKKDILKIRELKNGNWPYKTNSKANDWHKQRLSYLTQILQHSLSWPVLLSATLLEEKEFIRIVSSLERFFFGYKIIGQKPANDFADIYYEYAGLIRKRKNSYTVNKFIGELKKIRMTKLPDDEFKLIILNLKYRKKQSNKMLRYLLFLIDEYWAWYQGGGKGTPRRYSQSIVINFSKTSIEHIYPVTSKEIIENLESLKHDLGNLAFYDGGDNQAAQNEEFKVKRKFYKHSRVNMLVEISRLQNWSNKGVLKRSKELSKMAVKILVP